MRKRALWCSGSAPVWVWGVAAVLLTACGARQAAIEGPGPAPSADVAPVTADGHPPDDLETFMEKVGAVSAEVKPATRAAVTVEASDPRLATALAAAVVQPSPATYRLVAHEYRRLGVLDKAYEYLNKALRLDPRDAATFDTLARVWRDWGMPQLALGDAYRAVFYAPASAAARNTLGTVLQALGRRDLAREQYGQALSLDPQAAYALNNLCYAWVLEARGREAEAACRAALSLQPDLAAAGNNLGLALAVRGEVEAAAEAFGDAVDAASARYNEGIVLLAARRYEAALAAFEAAHRDRPDLRLADVRARQTRRLMLMGEAR